MNPNEPVFHAVLSAVQEALGVTDGGFASLYFHDELWSELSYAVRNNDAHDVARTLGDYVRAERQHAASCEEGKA